MAQHRILIRQIFTFLLFPIYQPIVPIEWPVLNVGLGKAAMQSSTAGMGSAQKAVDGLTSQFFAGNTCTMTDAEANPWWYVNLLEPYLVQIVRIDFGVACCNNGK